MMTLPMYTLDLVHVTEGSEATDDRLRMFAVWVPCFVCQKPKRKRTCRAGYITEVLLNENKASVYITIQP